jgi:hypothetical protein
MTEPTSAQELFKGRHFDQEIIVLCVRWYLTFKLSSRDLVQMMAERGITLTHTTMEGRRGTSMEGARALVRSNPVEARIDVTVIGEEEGSNRLIKLIRNHFQHIHRDVQGLDPNELVEIDGRRNVYKSVQILNLTSGRIRSQRLSRTEAA